MPDIDQPTDDAPLTRDEIRAIEALARRQRAANGLMMRTINFVGAQVDDTLKLLPQGARGQIERGVRQALMTSYELAARTRSGPAGRAIQSDGAHKAMATLSGAVGGFGGLPTALAELPVATTMIFRAVQSVAESYGEDPTSVETRMACLAVFGASDAHEESLDTAFLGARLGLTGAAVHSLIARVSPRFATVLTQKLATQAVPILGAAAGAGTNYAFTQYYVEMAHVHFGLRKLGRLYGEDKVLDQFHTALSD